MQRHTRLAVSLVAAALVLTGFAATTAPSAWPLDAPTFDPTATAAQTCDAVFGSDAGPQTPSKGAVAPEQSIAEDVTWKANWKPGSTVEVVACGAIDGKFQNELSTIQPAKPNDGLFVHTFAVPKDTANGALVCERGVVLGESASGAPQAERTDADCFTVAVAKGAAPAAAGPPPVSAPSAASEKPDAAPTGSAAAPPGPRQAAEAGAGTAKSPIVAGATESRSAAEASTPGSASAAAPTAGLARTAANDRMLLAAAGLLFLLGGFMLVGSGSLRPAGQRH